jgi:hypothetical protein
LSARHDTHFDPAVGKMERKIREDLTRRGMVREKEAVQKNDAPCR